MFHLYLMWQNGITPTIMAAYANCPSVLQLLMKNGADMTLSMQVPMFVLCLLLYRILSQAL